MGKQIYFFLLLFVWVTCFCMAESTDLAPSDSLIQEQLQGKVVGVSLFSVNFWALGEDRSWLNNLLSENGYTLEHLELVKTEIFYSSQVPQDFIQRRVAELFINILNLKEEYVLETDQSRITNQDKKTGNSTLTPYVKEAVLVNRKLDPFALSRGFLASLGGEYAIDILFTGLLTMESCLFVDTREANKYYLAFQIVPLVKSMNPLSGEVLDLNELVKEGMVIHSTIIEMTGDMLSQKTKITELLLHHIHQTLSCYFPLLSTHLVQKL